jgi:Xaa-Pro dipeptidase
MCKHFYLEQFESRGLVTDHPPIVAVNPNNGDPHYDPQSEKNSIITKDSLVLIDLWAKFAQGDCVFADITWMSYFGNEIPQKIVDVFNLVRDARNAAINFVKENISNGSSIKGFQVDDISRKIISDGGYGDYFLHRTGHSMGPGDFLHARGVNIDNFETHDEREITSSVGFSIEPGIYLPDFGIRSEVDVFIHPDVGAIVTTPLQEEIEHFTI